MILISSVYAELEPGKLEINGIEIPYSVEEVGHPMCESDDPGHCVVYDIMRDCERCDLCEWFDEYNQCCPNGNIWYERWHTCVDPIEIETDPPTVTLLNEIPSIVEPDVIFEVDLAVDDISGVSDVNLKVRLLEIRPRRYVPEGTTLAAANTKYIAAVDTVGFSSGEYTILAEAEDVKGNKGVVEVGTFSIEDSPICRELFPGHNNLNENRFNIVFVGLGYYNKRNFIEFAKRSADLDYNNGLKGLFQVEPFKSNKDRFNIWYVNEIGRIPANCDSNHGDSDRCAGRISNYGALCPFNNKVSIGLVNDEFRSWARDRSVTAVSFKDYFSLHDVPLEIFDDDFLNEYCSGTDLNNDGHLDVLDKYYDANGDGLINSHEFESSSYNELYSAKTPEDRKKIDGCILVNYNTYSKFQAEKKFAIVTYEYQLDGGYTTDWPTIKDGVLTTIHEFGHLYAYLADEYLDSSGAWHPTTRNCVDWTDRIPMNIAQKQQACLQTAKWKARIGDGCGEDRVVDCVRNNNYNEYYFNALEDGMRELYTDSDEWYNNRDNFDSGNVNYEIYCYQGCNYDYGKQRSTFNSIMRSHYSKKFGLYNDEWICYQIKQDTGRVGGYCTEKFGMT